MKLPPLPDYPKYPLIEAQVWKNPIPRYNSNPLITALRPLPDTPDLVGILTRLPEYHPSERKAPSGQRKFLLQSVFNTFLGLPRIVHLMESIHAMMLYSYVDRAPHTPESAARRQEIYELGSIDDVFKHCNSKGNGEFTVALLGLPGTGKTEAVKNITLHLRCVIHHEALGIYQIPCLFIEMPPRGASVLTLARNIITALDAAFPAGNYKQIYLSRVRNSEILLMDAMALLEIHYVGVLIVDESQNKNYLKYGTGHTHKTGEGQTPLASMLIAATNFMKIPMVLCGTAELLDTLSSRLSMKRRLVGRNIPTWGPLSLPTFNSNNEMVDIGEFDVFLRTIWRYQWTKTPFKLDDTLRQEFVYQTLCIPDLIVKLFYAIQETAINNGEDEVVDIELVRDVARKEFSKIAETLEDMRKNNHRNLAKVADVAAYLKIPKNRSFFNSFQPARSTTSFQRPERETDTTQAVLQSPLRPGEAGANPSPSSAPAVATAAPASPAKAVARKDAIKQPAQSLAPKVASTSSKPTRASKSALQTTSEKSPAKKRPKLEATTSLQKRFNPK